MSTSLRDVMKAAVTEAAPPSTVDIDAALSIGQRRRGRRERALSLAGTCAAVAVVVATATYVGEPAPVATPGGRCMDQELMSLARRVLPPAGQWSPRPLADSPNSWHETCDGLDTARGFRVLVGDERGTGALEVVVAPTGGTLDLRIPPEDTCGAEVTDQVARWCRDLPAGTLILGGGALDSRPGSDTMDYRVYSGVHVMTPAGVQVVVETVVCPTNDQLEPSKRPGPDRLVGCRDEPPYSVDQLVDLAAALVRFVSPGAAEGGWVGGKLWVDRNGNGVWDWDNGETALTGVAGTKVELYGDNGFHREAMVDSRGNYGFTGVPDGRYVLAAPALAAAGYERTERGRDMTADQMNGMSDTFVLCCNQIRVMYVGYTRES